jgi:hypothetical protein
MSKHHSLKQINRYGLSRNIPSPIKREVRKKCGFGCVVCGSIIIDYHHFDPPFSLAKFHNPNGIALLCGGCHTKVTRGVLSNDTVAKAARKPKCLEQGFSHFPLDVGEQFPLVLLGNSTFIGNPTIIRAFGNRLFAIDKPEEIGSPFRISAVFYDRNGIEACRLIENEWKGLASNWDITSKGNAITVHRAHGEIAHKMRTNPPDKLVIERLDLFYKGFRIVVKTNGQTTTYLPDGRMWFQLDGATFIGNDAVIVIDDNINAA